ncbi:hypothetical protein L7F22_041771, partial [Adiantum nelumboides]|nr:hypothetical protein [Adiantum nelumboides]
SEPTDEAVAFNDLMYKGHHDGLSSALYVGDTFAINPDALTNVEDVDFYLVNMEMISSIIAISSTSELQSSSTTLACKVSSVISSLKTLVVSLSTSALPALDDCSSPN